MSRYICASPDPEAETDKDHYCNFESDDEKQALQHAAANTHKVIDRTTGGPVGASKREPGRFICTKPGCGFEAEYLEQAHKHHTKTGEHRVVDRIHGVPADHEIAGTRWNAIGTGS